MVWLAARTGALHGIARRPTDNFVVAFVTAPIDDVTVQRVDFIEHESG